MVGVELLIVLLAIWLGARLGGIGIGFAGGLGVLVLTLFCGMKPGAIPFDVIEIIMAVIAAIAAMQIAGGSITWLALPNVCCAAIHATSRFLLRWSPM